MANWTRRGVLAAAGGGLAACATQPSGMTGVPGVANIPGAQIDAAVDAALVELYGSIKGSETLAQRAQGVLVMPNINQLGFFAGGAYGEGALRIRGVTVDYYSLSAVSLGFTIGAQAFNQALFFITPEALQQFRLADGWTLGVDAAVVVNTDGAAAGIDSATYNRPMVEVIFGQRGLIADASLGGAKYSRIYR